MTFKKQWEHTDGARMNTKEWRKLRHHEVGKRSLKPTLQWWYEIVICVAINIPQESQSNRSFMTWVLFCAIVSRLYESKGLGDSYYFPFRGGGVMKRTLDAWEVCRSAKKSKSSHKVAKKRKMDLCLKTGSEMAGLVLSLCFHMLSD